MGMLLVRNDQIQTLADAQAFIGWLVNAGLNYHLEDDPVDCIGHLVTQAQAQAIGGLVQQCYRDEIQWGKYECPIGYMLERIRQRDND